MALLKLGAKRKVKNSLSIVTGGIWDKILKALIGHYTPRNEVRGGVYWNHPVRPSVRLSVDARLGKMVSRA